MAGNTGLQRQSWDRHPGQKAATGGDHALLQPEQTDAGKAEAAFPVGIDPPPLSGEAGGMTLRTAEQHSESDDEQP
jgi:hypothetical protein